MKASYCEHVAGDRSYGDDRWHVFRNDETPPDGQGWRQWHRPLPCELADEALVEGDFYMLEVRIVLPSGDTVSAVTGLPYSEADKYSGATALLTP